MVLPRAEALPSSVTPPLWLLSAVTTATGSCLLVPNAQNTSLVYAESMVAQIFFWFIHYAEL